MAQQRHFLLTALVLTSLTVEVRGQETTWNTEEVMQRLDSLEQANKALVRQLMLQQFSVEEARRSDGDSGVKQVRLNRGGSRPLYNPSHVATATASIHDHSDLRNTCGMGEIEAVLNGFHFRTRHNDYKLVMPSRSSTDYHAVEDIEFPPVPQEVTNQTTFAEQIREMRAWFRAWQDGDTSTRDYRPYFRPLLCYLEGAWTYDVNIDEPFDSDRHHLDAISWYDLQEKIRFTSYTGDKDPKENYAFLPVSFMNMTDGKPVSAQWNYRILCHPIQGEELKLSDLKAVDDLAPRVARENTLDKFFNSRAQRFAVDEFDSDRSIGNRKKLIDRLMNQIPGKDNYMGSIQDDALMRTKLDPDTGETLNTAYYHRVFAMGASDAMGVTVNRRGFADQQMWVAQTTQPRVVPMSVEYCRQGQCESYTSRTTYAIPLEIVWLTPLNGWNPYNIEYKGWSWSDEGKTVTADGRNGGFNASTAFNGTNHKTYFLTPVEFFAGGEHNSDPADTVRGAVGVLDSDGNVRRVSESGIRIHLPEIVDVGANVRTRYPVFPIFAEGSTAWKELEAMEKTVMDFETNMNYLHTVPNFGGSASQEPTEESPFYILATQMSTDPDVGQHFHHLELPVADALNAMNEGQTLMVRTTQNNGHTHLMNVTFDRDDVIFKYSKCDNGTCFDGHGPLLYQDASGMQN